MSDLNIKQQRLLAQANRSIGGFMTLSPKQALTARALDRRGFGKYTRTDEYCAFQINDRGKRTVSGGNPPTTSQPSKGSA